MAQHNPTSMSLPPPAMHNLLYMGRVVGWTSDSAIGFRGFASEDEAASAAWIAYGAIARRLAREGGVRPTRPAGGPLSIVREGEGRDVILAGSQPVGVLLRPGLTSPTGADWFGFEVEVPPPAGPVRVRAIAHLVSRTLRQTGTRWTMWEEAPANALVRAVPDVPSALGALARVVLVAVAIVAAMAIILAAPPGIAVPVAITIAAVLAVVASGAAARVRGRARAAVEQVRRTDGSVSARERADPVSPPLTAIR